MITLREAAVELTTVATELRDIAGRIDGPAPEHWAAARDIRAIAESVAFKADQAERLGIALREPDPGDLSWLVAAAPGEIVEVMGR